MISELPFHPSSSDNCTGVDASAAENNVNIMGLPIQFILMMMVLVLQALKKGQEGRLGSALKASIGMVPEGVKKKIGSVLMSALGGLGSLVVVAAAGKTGHESNLDRSYSRVSSHRDSDDSSAMFELD